MVLTQSRSDWANFNSFYVCANCHKILEHHLLLNSQVSSLKLGIMSLWNTSCVKHCKKTVLNLHIFMPYLHDQTLTLLFIVSGTSKKTLEGSGIFENKYETDRSVILLLPNILEGFLKNLWNSFAIKKISEVSVVFRGPWHFRNCSRCIWQIKHMGMFRICRRERHLYLKASVCFKGFSKSLGYF